ncbi:unnamed protein product [Rotaria magnacalcarata]|uniref:Uncharacterized protein n=1 Tax=Rotaria magnacalcarata TaxID=392030 RepID=A0A816TVY7_9BILA|nr:unnamed protein product [Rotaria magnacalcarata]CAF2138948.1 unnamed protein product [Rotaria magnacalcarata]CAF4142834.1 unnamed protein product [Rotaria magnacalcarata]CAF4161420.1 unnamed protein product [Rotaria magnacalcarata]
MKLITFVLVCFIVAALFTSVFGAPTDDDDPVIAGSNGEVASRRFTCNSITGDWVCAGQLGSWRCKCGSACYNSVCTCKRCI